MRHTLANPADYSADNDLGADYYRLLFNYLRISPSYALICHTASHRITPRTPLSSRRTIQTYRKYGDVYQSTFCQWSGPAQKTSGNRTLNEQPLLLSAGQTIRCPDGYDGFLIPRHLGMQEKLRLARLLIEALPATDKPLAGQSIRLKTLWKALAVVYERAKHPNIELWRIGLLAQLVERFTDKLDPWCEKKSAKDAQMRRHLTLMTVRAIFLALVIAENAAQGFFPTRTPVSGEQLEFPFAQQRLHALLSAQGDAEYRVILAHATARVR